MVASAGGEACVSAVASVHVANARVLLRQHLYDPTYIHFLLSLLRLSLTGTGTGAGAGTGTGSGGSARGGRNSQQFLEAMAQEDASLSPADFLAVAPPQPPPQPPLLPQL